MTITPDDPRFGPNANPNLPGHYDPSGITHPPLISQTEGENERLTDAGLHSATDRISGILEEIRTLRQDRDDDKEELNNKEKKAVRWLKTGAGIIAFDFIVALAALFFILSTVAIVHRVDDVVARLDRYAHNDCVLYGFVINSYNPEAKNRSVLGPAKYDDFYKQMQSVTDDRGCGIPHKVPGT